MTDIRTNIEIIPFSEALAFHFTWLNADWLQKYFVIEPVDHQMPRDSKH